MSELQFKDFKYERLNYEDLANQYENILTKLSEAHCPKCFQNAFNEMNELRKHVQTMMTLCSVRNTIDKSDKFYETEQEYWDETYPKLQVFETRFKQIVLDYPNKDQLSIPETFYKLAECEIKSFDEKIVEDLQKENKLVSEYGKLKSSAKIEFEGETYNLASIASKTLSNDRKTRENATAAVAKFYADNEEEFDRIYDELVQVRTTMAKKLGFDNYIPLGYLRMNRLDYNQEMVATYRQQILDYVTPVCSKIYDKQRQRLGLDKLKAWDINYEFESGNAKPHGTSDELVAAALAMYKDMGSDTGEFFQMMVDRQLFDLLTKPNKDMGGYCTDIPDYKVPFIFANFNGTSGDVDVLTHEAGHAFQSFMTSKYQENLVPDCSFPTMEACEIHSMSMEFFAHPYMNDFFKEDTQKYIYSHIAGALTFLPYGACVDHFQHQVYANPNMSKEERKQCWRTLEKTYIPERDYTEFPVLEKGGYWYRQGHIFASPFYYIDYTLAQVCALQFFARSLAKDENTWKDYIELCKLGGTKTFLHLLEAAHLQSPFQQGCLSGIVEAMDKELDAIDDKAL